MNLRIDNAVSNEIKLNENLIEIIKQNTLSNAYIFHGPENIGKKELAIKFISEIIKKNNSNLEVFYKLKDNNFPDYLMIEPTYALKGKLINKSEMDSASKRKTKPLIRIEQIRNIKDFLSKKSIQSDRKFIIITDAHLLNEASSNCLLKTLEEPTNGIFILITSRINNLLDTIISRCQAIRFSPYSNKQLNLYLENSKNITSEFLLDRQKLDNLINISNGSPGKLSNNLEIWKQIPEQIKERIKMPLDDYEDILYLAKDVSKELDLYQQEVLLDFIQRDWWEKTKNRNIAEIIEGIKRNINANLQPRLSWEIGLFKIKLLNS